MKKIIELEYHFEIPAESLLLKVPSIIAGFKINSFYDLQITDILLETKGKSLKSENAGMRIRKTDNKIEFTYKKFLGAENGAAKFDEQSIQIGNEDYQKALDGNFSQIEYLNRLVTKLNMSPNDVYSMLIIFNKRKVFNFVHGSCGIEMVLEDITYKLGEKEVADAMMEMEITSHIDEQEAIDAFVTEAKEIFQCTIVNEGKNTRGMRLLNI